MTKPPFSPDGDDSQPADERGFFAEQPAKRSGLGIPAAQQEEAHYHGHRDRLRTRYRDHGTQRSQTTKSWNCCFFG